MDALFAFSLLRLIASTCFEHLFAHHQEALYVQQLVCFVRIMPAGCWQGWGGATTNCDEQISARNTYRLLIVINRKQIVHFVGLIILIYYNARSTKYTITYLFISNAIT
jgi:hypothetical protein